VRGIIRLSWSGCTHAYGVIRAALLMALDLQPTIAAIEVLRDGR
jgi:hypothetical protein